MSRLDSFIRRLEAQRIVLNWAAAAIAGREGPVLELGLGNGRTYDHLRDILPGRAIHAFDRQAKANPRSMPEAPLLVAASGVPGCEGAVGAPVAAEAPEVVAAAAASSAAPVAAAAASASPAAAGPLMIALSVMWTS